MGLTHCRNSFSFSQLIVHLQCWLSDRDTKLSDLLTYRDKTTSAGFPFGRKVANQSAFAYKDTRLPVRCPTRPDNRAGTVLADT